MFLSFSPDMGLEMRGDISMKFKFGEHSAWSYSWFKENSWWIWLWWCPRGLYSCDFEDFKVQRLEDTWGKRWQGWGRNGVTEPKEVVLSLAVILVFRKAQARWKPSGLGFRLEPLYPGDERRLELWDWTAALLILDFKSIYGLICIVLHLCFEHVCGRKKEQAFAILKLKQMAMDPVCIG